MMKKLFVMMLVLCLITTVTSIEDLAINLSSKELDSNVKSIFSSRDRTHA